MYSYGFWAISFLGDWVLGGLKGSSEPRGAAKDEVLGMRNRFYVSATVMAKICVSRGTGIQEQLPIAAASSTKTVNRSQNPAKDCKNYDGFTCRQSGGLFFCCSHSPSPPFTYDSSKRDSLAHRIHLI